MECVHRAEAILQQTEANLRNLVSEAAASGDYASVLQIAAWARAVSELARSAPRKPSQVQTPQSQAKAVEEGPSARRHARRAPADPYPRFFRHDDQLIRVAWSKREKKEYQHKAPRTVIDALTKAMLDIGVDGRIFSTEQILPLRDAEGGEVPSYQAYVGIALLKQTGLIDQHGRRGYSIPRLEEFKHAVESVWSKLPQL